MTEETEAVQEVPETQELQETHENNDVKEVQEPSKKVDSDHNWKQATEVLKAQKRELEELRAQMAEMNRPKEQPKPEIDEFADLDPNDYLTVEKARDLARKTAKREAEEAAKKIVQEYSQQQTLVSDEARCKSKYEDYDYIIENFAIPQIKNDPALAYKIQSSKNPAETAYKIGKLSDSYEESMTKQQTSPKAEKILKNASRPLPGAASGSSLKSQADQFSKMSRSEIWEMSQKYASKA